MATRVVGQRKKHRDRRRHLIQGEDNTQGRTATATGSQKTIKERFEELDPTRSGRSRGTIELRACRVEATSGPQLIMSRAARRGSPYRARSRPG